ncbi:hypothetical protein ABIF69_008554 [Bradyrhizobium japonicum]
MKWMLVVLVGGMTPVNTDLVFDKFADCLAAEEQMRKHYTDAFEVWDRWAAANIERRREYSKMRDLPGQTPAKQHRYVRSSCRRRCHSAAAAEQFDALSASSSRTHAAAKSETVTSERSEHKGRKRVL